MYLAQEAATVALPLKRWQNQRLAHTTAATRERIFKGVHLPKTNDLQVKEKQKLSRTGKRDSLCYQ